MADQSTFGGETLPAGNGEFGSGLVFGGDDASAPAAPEPAPGPNGADIPPEAPVQPVTAQGGFGSSLRNILPGPHYTPPDPQASALDQSASMLQQRVKRANEISANPIASFFNPEGVMKAREFAAKGAEELQKIRGQQATMAAGRQQAATLGLAPGEVADEASQNDRVEVAKARALKGDLRVFQGLQQVDAKAAEAIAPQVHEAVAGHLTKAQYAFDKLSNMTSEGEYNAAVRELRQNGDIKDLEQLGLKVPPSFSAFQASKSAEGNALREARIGVDSMKQKLEDRNTYQPMEEKEAKTYENRMTTAYGDKVTVGTWGRNASSNARGLIVNGAADPRDLGKSYVLGSEEQRKALRDESDLQVTKAEIDKNRSFSRTYELATTDGKGNKLPEGKINTNPNVQQGIAEGLASMLRGGGGGATGQLLRIESNKRGYVQSLIDSIATNYAGGINALRDGADPEKVKPYLTNLTQRQMRDVMDTLKAYNDSATGSRVGRTAERAGALGFDASVLGYGKGENAEIDDAIERGKQAQIARMMPNHQPLGRGDGVFQLDAQRPGAGATSVPAGTAPTTQIPGAQPLMTPVQQSQQPPASVPPPSLPGSGGGNPPPSATAPAPTSGPQPSGGGAPPAPTAPQPVTIAGQSVTPPKAPPPGLSPAYYQSVQRIESGNVKDPWTAGTKTTSATGAYQFTKDTWNENKPVGAPDTARDATPQQQTEAFANLTEKNANALASAGVPVNDRNVYVAHNLGGTGGVRLLQADPNADARTVVGARAAANNPLFFRGKPTVQQALDRYDAEMKKGAGSGAVAAGDKTTAGAQSTLGKLGAWLTSGPGLLAQNNVNPETGLTPEGNKALAEGAVEHAPAIGSTAGALIGSTAGPLGTIGGGAAGGGAGQALKDYLQGTPQSATRIAKEAALGGVLGVAPEGRAILGAGARVLGAGGVEAGSTLAEGGDGADAVDAAVKGGAAAVGGELFGPALGMAGHKVFGMFSSGAQKAVQTAAKDYHEATKVLETETPKLPGVGGAAGGPNPKYAAAEAARDKAEKTLTDAGLKPEEAAYAHKVSSEGVATREAQVMKPAQAEQRDIGAGYQDIERQVGDKGVGAPKAAPKLADGPIAAVENKQVLPKHQELAEHVEMAITAPAKSWQDKWVQLKEARSDLLTAERDALASTSTGKSREAKDMRTLADTVRAQQAKVAEMVFGKDEGQKVMQRLNVLDTRYRNLMEATSGMGFQKMASTMKSNTEASRSLDRKFKAAFAHDPDMLKTWDTLRKYRDPEATVPWTVAAEGLPVVGKVVKIGKLWGLVRDAMREQAAGSPVKFRDMIQKDPDFASPALATAGRNVVQRGALQ